MCTTTEHPIRPVQAVLTAGRVGSTSRAVRDQLSRHLLNPFTEYLGKRAASHVREVRPELLDCTAAAKITCRSLNNFRSLYAFSGVFMSLKDN